MLLQLHLWHQHPCGAFATDAAARLALSSALLIWEVEIFKGRGKKKTKTAFFISLTAHYHGNSPGLAWLAGPPLLFSGGNNTIRWERGGEMRAQYCIQSIILQLNVFSCRMGRSALGGRVAITPRHPTGVWRKRETWVCSIAHSFGYLSVNYSGGEKGFHRSHRFFKCILVYWQNEVHV